MAAIVVLTCLTGELKGKIEVDGKGGKIRELQVSPAVYAALKAAIAANDGVFKIADYKAYVAALEKSAGNPVSLQPLQLALFDLADFLDPAA